MTDAAGAGKARKERKARYLANFVKVIDEYKNALIVGIDNVGSLQMQKVRKALRGKAVMVMGKKTLIRKILRDNIQRNPKLEALLPFMRGNTGLVFTNEDLATVRNICVEFKVPAAAKAGTMAPTDIFVPAGPTGLDPGQTSFFQALNIATKIARGSIEIINEVHLCKKGEKVTSSMTALLGKLNILPFFYGITVKGCFEDGSTYPIEVLDLKPEDLMQKFMNGVGQLTALSLALDWPNQLTVPIQVAGAFRKLASIALAVNYPLKELETLAKAAAAAASAPKEEKKEDKKDGKKDDKKKEEKKKEEAPAEEEEAVGGFGDLFG